MLKLSRRTVTLAASSGLSAILGVAMLAAPAAAADDQEIAQALRAGGLVIVVRHGATFSDQADTDPLNFDNITAQRNLNDKGKSARCRNASGMTRASVLAVFRFITNSYLVGFWTGRSDSFAPFRMRSI